jgi:hypothetical protein
LAEQEHLLPPAAFRRLWRGEWVDGAGDAIPPERIEKAFDPSLAPMTWPESGWGFIMGVDLGVKRDFSACITMAVPLNRSGRLRLAAAQIWRPPAGGQVSLSEVEEYVLEMDRKLGLDRIVLDAWQAQLLGERLELATSHRRRTDRKHFWSESWVTCMQQTSATLRDQAALLIEHFADDKLQLFPFAPLKAALLSLRCEERASGGFKLTAPRTSEGGHADAASALMLCLPLACELTTKRAATAGFICTGFTGGDSDRGMFRQIFSEATGPIYMDGARIR